MGVHSCIWKPLCNVMSNVLRDRVTVSQYITLSPATSLLVLTMIINYIYYLWKKVQLFPKKLLTVGFHQRKQEEILHLLMPLRNYIYLFRKQHIQYVTEDGVCECACVRQEGMWQGKQFVFCLTWSCLSLTSCKRRQRWPHENKGVGILEPEETVALPWMQNLNTWL